MLRTVPAAALRAHCTHAAHHKPSASLLRKSPMSSVVAVASAPRIVCDSSGVAPRDRMGDAGACPAVAPDTPAPPNGVGPWHRIWGTYIVAMAPPLPRCAGLPRRAGLLIIGGVPVSWREGGVPGLEPVELHTRPPIRLVGAPPRSPSRRAASFLGEACETGTGEMLGGELGTGAGGSGSACASTISTAADSVVKRYEKSGSLRIRPPAKRSM
eukprot:m.170402 g.170402  ORF g.170402 m.170402 type:complete len:213 (-) comp24204_c0_seq2:1076-1714(-)